MEEPVGAVASLSRRELEVAIAYGDGLSYRQIAERLGIAPATVRTHIGTIYQKLGVSTKIELGRALRDAGVTGGSSAAPALPLAQTHAGPDTRAAGTGSWLAPDLVDELKAHYSRLADMITTLDDVLPARPANTDGEPWIRGFLSHMDVRRIAAGETLIRKGEHADSLYYLSQGTVELPEIGSRFGPGAVIGEIGIFAPHHTRTATVVAATDCEVYVLPRAEAERLFRHDPAFSRAILTLVIDHLMPKPDDPGDDT